MAILTSYNAAVIVNSVDLSDHCIRASVNDGQETRDATAHSLSARVFRAGLSTPSIELQFHGDHASGSVEATLRALIGITSTGNALTVKKDAANAASTNNPLYQFDTAILDGDLMVMDDEVGEIPQIVGRFLPSGSFTVITTATST